MAFLRRILVPFLAPLLLLMAGCASRETPAAARYLDGAEIQAETDAQRADVGKALSDMLMLTTDQLRTARYGTAQEALPTVLRAHVVPTGPVPVQDEDFFAQAADPKVRAAVEKLRTKLKKENP